MRFFFDFKLDFFKTCAIVIAIMRERPKTTRFHSGKTSKKPFSFAGRFRFPVQGLRCFSHKELFPGKIRRQDLFTHNNQGISQFRAALCAGA